jgi:hypothetical protein
VSYFDAPSGVTVSLVAGTATGGEGVDELRSVRDIVGSLRGDTIHGNAQDNVIRSRAGRDTVSGGDGDDRLFGARGRDTIDGGSGNDLCAGAEVATNCEVLAVLRRTGSTSGLWRIIDPARYLGATLDG